MRALAPVVALPRNPTTIGIALRHVERVVPPDPRVRSAWVASFGVSVLGFRRTLAGTEPALGALGQALAEWVANARDGLALQLRVGRRRETLSIGILVSVSQPDAARAENVGTARRDELLQILAASPVASCSAPIDEATLLSWTDGAPFHACSVAVPGGAGVLPLAAEMVEPPAASRVVDLLLAQPGEAMVVVSARRAPHDRALGILADRVSASLADVRGRAQGAVFTTGGGVQVQRLPADVVDLAGAQQRLEREAGWIARIAQVSLEVQVAVLGERRPGAPLLHAVANALVPSLDVGWEQGGRATVTSLLLGADAALDDIAVGTAPDDCAPTSSPLARIARRLVPVSVGARLLSLPLPGPDGLPGVPMDPLVARPVPNAVLAARPEAARLGEAPRRGVPAPVRLGAADLMRHLYVSGKTGVGKSTLLRTLLLDLARKGHGIGLIDPHGDLADEVASAVGATRPVTLFDPSSSTCLGLDPLAHDGSEAGQERAVEDLTGIMFSLYPGDYMGPMFDRHSRALLIPLIAAKHGLASMSRLANDASFRRGCLLALDNENPLHREVKDFWENEFSQWGTQLKGEMASYTISKYDALIKSSALRRVCDPFRPPLDVRRVLDDGGILIARLPEGSLGQVSAWFLGMLLLQRLRGAAFSRGQLPPERRKPFCLAIDEFQKFVGDGCFGYAQTTRTLAPMLDECRKFGVALVLANQYAAQLDARTRDAVFGNVGSMVCFRAGADDAALLANELGHGTTPEELRGLPLFHALSRLLVDGQTSPIFTLRTTPGVDALGEDPLSTG